jgi:hypothetical protein
MHRGVWLYRNSWAAILDTIRLVCNYRQRKRFLGEGFEIREYSTWGFDYIEGSHVLRISTGIGKKRDGKWYETWVTVEMQDPLSWEPPHQNEPIGPEERARVRENISRYFETFVIPFQILE